MTFGQSITGRGNRYFKSAPSLTGPATSPIRNPAMKLAAPLGRNKLNSGKGRRSLAPQRTAQQGSYDQSAMGEPGSGITDY